MLTLFSIFQAEKILLPHTADARCDETNHDQPWRRWALRNPLRHQIPQRLRNANNKYWIDLIAIETPCCRYSTRRYPARSRSRQHSTTTTAIKEKTIKINEILWLSAYNNRCRYSAGVDSFHVALILGEQKQNVRATGQDSRADNFLREILTTQNLTRSAHSLYNDWRWNTS